MSAKRHIHPGCNRQGYIGGAVLSRLLYHRTAQTSEITALVRTPAKLPLFARIGVKVLFGTLDDEVLLERQASKSDIVIACADADHVTSCKALLRGLKKRYEMTGTQLYPYAVLHDDARGMSSSDIIWDDTDLDQLEEIPNNDPHRPTDPLILTADKEGYARTHIVLPSTVYGIATGILVDLGIQHPRSIEIPKLIKLGMKRERAGMFGLGLNIWSNVHIDDVGDLYLAVYDGILDGRAGHGLEGLYFGENGEDIVRSMAERIGEAFVEFGICSPEERMPTSFDSKDYARPGNEHLRLWYGLNERCRANRARGLGWEPKHTTEDMLNTTRGEVEWEFKHNDSL